jgi:prepilin-type N-terminal cleavage/methylation domain-containing protein
MSVSKVQSPRFTTSKLRARAAREDGFTLIEILVVVLILAVLAAIVLAVFLNQRGKGADAEAKSAVKTAAQTMENCGIENSGIYNLAGAPCDAARLVQMEPNLADQGSRFTVDSLGRQTYRVTVASERAPSEVRYTIRRRGSGIVDTDCVVGSQDKGGCANSGAPGDDW